MNGYPEVRAAHLKDNESRINIIAELLKGVAVSDHVNQPKERSGKITKYCVHVF